MPATATNHVDSVAELLPEIREIRDESLRAKVAAVWEEAIRTGCGGRGWSFAELRSIPFTLLAGPCDMKFVEHLRSCALQCIAVERVLREVFGSRVAVDRDTLLAGALLADVGKLLEFDRDGSGNVVKGQLGEMLRHPFSGVGLAWKHGVPSEVMHVIATHSHEGDKVDRSVESIIFHHCDFIDFDIAKALSKKAQAKR